MLLQSVTSILLLDIIKYIFQIYNKIIKNTCFKKRNYEFDDSKPILERYAMQMINKHYCEIRVPIL